MYQTIASPFSDIPKAGWPTCWDSRLLKPAAKPGFANKINENLGSYKQADDCPEKSLYVALVLEKLELGYHLYTKVKLPLSRIMKLIKNRSQPPFPFPFLPIFFPYRRLLRRLPIIEAQGLFSEYKSPQT